MADLFSGNPYLNDPRFHLSPEQQQQFRLSSLGSALTNFGAGIAQSGASGQPWFAGIAPGAAMASQSLGQSEARLAQMQEAAAKYQQMEDYRKSQEEHLKAQTDVARQGLAMDQKVLGMIDRIPGLGGFQPPQGPMMSVPGAASGPPVDLQKSGAPVVNYLTSQHGLSPQAAAGVAGNLFQESGFNPNAVGDGGKSRGIAQWDPDRYAGLTKFAAANGGSPTDPKTQLDYMMAEMKGGDMGAQRAFAGLQQAKTPQEAAAAMMHFERPQGYTPANPTAGHGFAQRAQYAQALMPNGSVVPQGGDAAGQPGGSPAGGPQVFQPPAVGQVPPYALPSNLPDPSAGNALALSPRFAPLGTALRSSAEFKRKEALDLEKFNYERQQKAEQQALETDKALTEKANRDVYVNPVTGLAEPNATAIGAKKEISAAQGTDPAGHGLKLLMDQAVKTHGEYQAAAQASRTANPNLERLGTLLEGLDTGKTKEITTDTKAWLKDLGVNLDGFGVLDDTGRAQAAKALGSQLALTLRNPANGGGLPGSMSNYEDKLLQGMSPSLVQTPEGNRILLDALRKQNQRTGELGRIANNWMRENGGKNLLNDPAGLYAVLDEYAKEHPLFTAEDAKKMTTGGTAGAAPAMQPGPSKEDLYKKYNLK